MAHTEMDIVFDGYWPWGNVSGVPTFGGIFCFYGGAHHWAPPTFSLIRLLYVGESENMREGIRAQMIDYESRQDYDDIYISAATLEDASARRLALAALIHAHAPPFNTTPEAEFPSASTVITTSGKNALLDSESIVSPQISTGK